MVSRELIKAEIDDVGEEYPDALFKIIKAFRRPLNTDKNDWHDLSKNFQVVSQSILLSGEVRGIMN